MIDGVTPKGRERELASLQRVLDVKAPGDLKQLTFVNDDILARYVRFAIEAINRGSNIPQREGEILECDLFGLAASTEDMREGMAAFLEKRKPSFKGK